MEPFQCVGSFEHVEQCVCLPIFNEAFLEMKHIKQTGWKADERSHRHIVAASIILTSHGCVTSPTHALNKAWRHLKKNSPVTVENYFFYGFIKWQFPYTSLFFLFLYDELMSM